MGPGGRREKVLGISIRIEQVMRHADSLSALIPAGLNAGSLMDVQMLRVLQRAVDITIDGVSRYDC